MRDQGDHVPRISSPFRKLLGIQEERIGDGEAELSMMIAPDLLQNQGFVHGGVLASLLDISIGSAMYSTLQEGQHSVTVELKINYIRPGKGNKLVAKSALIHRGETLSVGRSDIYDETGKLVASGSATFIVTK